MEKKRSKEKKQKKPKTLKTLTLGDLEMVVGGNSQYYYQQYSYYQYSYYQYPGPASDKEWQE